MPERLLFVGGAWDGLRVAMPQDAELWKVPVGPAGPHRPWGKPTEGNEPELEHQEYQRRRFGTPGRQVDLMVWTAITREDVVGMLVERYQSPEDRHEQGDARTVYCRSCGHEVTITPSGPSKAEGEPAE